MKRSLFSSTPVVVALAAVCTLLWGSAFPCVKLGYEYFAVSGSASQILFAGLRFALAGVLVLLLETVRKKRFPLPPQGSLSSICALGLVQTTVQYVFFYIGLAHTTGVKGSILNATGSFVAVVLAHFAYRDDRLNARKIAGCLLGFVGVVLINLNGGEAGSFSLWGEGFLMLAAAAFAVGFLLSKRATQKAEPGVVTGWQLFLGGAVLILLGLIGGGKITRITPQGVIMLLYLALLSAAAFTLWTLLLQHNPVGRVAVFHFLTPIFGVLLSALILKEPFAGLKNVLSLLLVCAGIAVVNLTAPKAKPAP